LSEVIHEAAIAKDMHDIRRDNDVIIPLASHREHRNLMKRVARLEQLAGVDMSIIEAKLEDGISDADYDHITSAVSMIKHVEYVTDAGWYKYPEVKPPKPGEYLVFQPTIPIMREYIYISVYCTDGESESWGYGMPTHWHYLPEAPKDVPCT